MAAGLALAAAAPKPADCPGRPPRPTCQCLCEISSARPGGLIYVCAKQRWFCPGKAHRRPAGRHRRPAANRP